ncbi:MAG: ribosomal L7Ae/L30e/S12e/Gadd45 family protein [Lachnospiraceae bacterium]|nr:ribosomal L7Ae/L30e/S12e/Gadd45 family protein [Lachnospiraceae bacterium]
MQNEALSVLSLAMKAGKLVSGGDRVLDALREGTVCLVVLSEDASENTKKRFHDQCAYRNVVLVEAGTRDSLAKAVGKDLRSVAAIKDEGFRNLFLRKLNLGE